MCDLVTRAVELNKTLNLYCRIKAGCCVLRTLCSLYAIASPPGHRVDDLLLLPSPPALPILGNMDSASIRGWLRGMVCLTLMGERLAGGGSGSSERCILGGTLLYALVEGWVIDESGRHGVWTIVTLCVKV